MRRKIVRNAVRAVILAAAAAAGGPRCGAATTSLATTNDYYYTVPKSTNIVGRVMGERGDYGLVRYEDAAWIAEAWAERIALGGEWEVATNAPGPGLLVKGGGIWPTTTGSYWTNAVMSTVAVTNELLKDLSAGGTVRRILGAASGGAMTNEVRRLEGRVMGKLVAKAAMTNAYKVLKGMDVVVKAVSPGDTNTARIITAWTQRETETGEGTTATAEATTGTVSATSWWLSCEGSKSVWREYEWDGSQWENTWTLERERTEKEEVVGEGDVRLEFGVRRKEDWMRGETSPKVVRGARAWGVVHLTGDEYEHEDRKRFEDGEVIEEEPIDRGWATNATVLVDLGEARWKEAKGGSSEKLVYEVTVKPARLLAECVGAAQWMPSLAQVESALGIPEVHGDAGSHRLSRTVQGILKEVYLVITLKPVTSLPGW